MALATDTTRLRTQGQRVVAGTIPGVGCADVRIVDAKIRSIELVDREDPVTLVPGLLDVQVNGYDGIDLNDGAVTPEKVSSLVRALLAEGVTGFCPTFVTAPLADLVAGLRAVAAAMADDPLARHCILGVHLEGPWISPEDGARGAHTKEHVRAATPEELDALTGAGAPISIITMAPEVKGVIDVIPEVVARGIVAAIGHSAAEPEDIKAAVAAGATLSTHLGNGLAAALPRHPNLLWSQLAADRLWASFIADSHHLDAETLSVMIAAKGLDRSILVSDTVAVGGLAPGVYETHVGGRVELSASGRLALADTAYLAGAARPLIEGVAWLAGTGILDLCDALRLSTENPSELLQTEGENRGRIAVDGPADLVRIDMSNGRPTVLEVIVGGTTVHGEALT
ncbi:MAG: N-acetylglucosamine-6-phosphate deacetylase [Actinomycetota bacterium]